MSGWPAATTSASTEAFQELERSSGESPSDRFRAVAHQCAGDGGPEAEAAYSQTVYAGNCCSTKAVRTPNSKPLRRRLIASTAAGDNAADNIQNQQRHRQFTE